MHVINIHKRTYNTSRAELSRMLGTLASKKDEIWPGENWPRMKLDRGLIQGSSGGHGPIGYFVESYEEGSQLVFRFNRPSGFDGIHKFDIRFHDKNTVELVHTIDMRTTMWAWIQWAVAIRWLHDALIEDGLDKIQNKISGGNKTTPWNVWVRLLRAILG